MPPRTGLSRPSGSSPGPAPRFIIDVACRQHRTLVQRLGLQDAPDFGKSAPDVSQRAVVDHVTRKTKSKLPASNGSFLSRLLTRLLAHFTPDDRAYLVMLVANTTGIAQPDAECRTDTAITAATVAVQKARRSAVVLAFSTAVSLLAGAATAWYASCLGGRYRDNVPPSLWRSPQRA